MRTHLMAILLLGASASATALAAPPIVEVGAPLTSQVPATVQLISPMLVPGAKLKVRVAEGKVGAIVIGNGVASVEITAPPMTAPGDVTLEIRIRGPKGETVESLVVPVVPGGDQTIGLSAAPHELLLGQGTVTVRLDLPPGNQANADRQIMVASNLGTLDNAHVTGTEVRWTPPDTMDGSAPVLITAADAADPDRIVGAFSFPLLVERSLSFKAEPDSNNLLIVGDRSYGPVPASPAGTVAFEVPVHPGARTAILRTVSRKGATSEQEVELQLAPTAPVAFVPLPDLLVHDPGQPIDVLLFVVDGAGAPREKAEPLLTATVGTVGELRPTSWPGLYSAAWTPPASGTEVRFTAQVDGFDALMDRPLSAPLATVDLQVDQLRAAGRTFKGQLSASAGSPQLSFMGARRTSTAAGGFVARAEGKRSFVYADAPAQPTGLPPANLFIWADADAPDGAGPSPISVVAIDAWGHPVPNTSVALSVTGDGSLPAIVNTGPTGLAHVAYTPGEADGYVRLNATAAGLEAHGLIFQGPDAAPGSARVPPAGDTAALAQLSRVRAGHKTAFVSRDAPPVVVAAAPTPATVGSASASAPAGTPGTPTPASADSSATDAPAVMAGDAPRFMVGVGALFHGHLYTSDGDLPATVEGFELYRPGLFGGQPLKGLGGRLDASGWFGANQTIGLAADLRAWRDPSGAGEPDDDHWDHDLSVDLRARTNTPVYGMVGVGGAHQSLDLYLFEGGDLTEFGHFPESVIGVRVSGGVGATIGPVFVEGLVAEVLAPYPVHTRAGLSAALAATDAVAMRLAWDYAIQSATYDIDGEDVSMKDGGHTLTLGVVLTGG